MKLYVISHIPIVVSTRIGCVIVTSEGLDLFSEIMNKFNFLFKKVIIYILYYIIFFTKK